MKPKLPGNGLSKKVNNLLTKAGIPIEKQAITNALKTGKLFVYHWPPNYGKYAHRDVCRWTGIDPATLPQNSADNDTTILPDIGLSYRAWRTLKRAGIPTTKAAVTKALQSGDLEACKRHGGYGKVTHAEVCRWVGIDPKTQKRTK